MKFSKKHPYLFWELMVLTLLFCSLLFVSFLSILGVNIDLINAILSYILMVSLSMMIFLPIIIFMICGKNLSLEMYDNLANEIMNDNKFNISILIFCLAFVIEIVFCALFDKYLYIFFGNFGEVVFLILMSCALLFVYELNIKYTIRKFYKVKDAQQYCELIQASDSDFLDRLDEKCTLAVLDIDDECNDKILSFLYNAMNFKGLIKDNKLKVYKVDDEFISKNYNFKITHGLLILCILPDDLNISDKNELIELFSNYRNNILFSYESVINILADN